MNPETVPVDTGGQGLRSSTPPIPPEFIPNVDDLIIEDDTPLDNIFMEKQERLLTEPLYSSWLGPGREQPWQVFANVGLFYQYRQDPLVPDVMLVVGARTGADLTRKENLSYFMWIIGKPPDVVIEMVSDRRGREADFKFDPYARIGVPYYVIFDPEDRLRRGVLRAFGNQNGTYRPLPEPWFPHVGLGLTLWQGTYQDLSSCWLRWRDAQGVLIPTGVERAEQERQRAEQERQRAERLEAQLRQLGIEPNS